MQNELFPKAMNYFAVGLTKQIQNLLKEYSLQELEVVVS
jgi:hypothetical protein